MKLHRLVLIAILASILTITFLGERIPVGDGMGWDGSVYARYTQHFDDQFFGKQIDSYRMQRVLLPFLLNRSFHILGIPFSNETISMGYVVANLLFIAISVWFYFLISTHLKLKPAEEIIGFSSLFYCFPILKYSLYYPVLTDVMAFCMGMVFVYCYMREKDLLCFLLIFLASFVFPTFILFSLLLIVKRTHSDQPPVPIINLLARLTLPALFCLIFVGLFWVKGYSFAPDDQRTTPIYLPLLIPSIIGALLYLWGISNLIPKRLNLLRSYEQLHIRNIAIFIGVVIASKLLINAFASEEEALISFRGFLNNLMYQALTNPLNYFVSHVMYWGLAPLLILFVSKPFREEVIHYGYGAIALFLGFGFFSLANESRQFVNIYPFFVVLLLLALRTKWEFSLTFAGIYAGISILLSRFWFQINANENFPNDNQIDGFQEFPLQQYFMFQGPWTSHQMYWIHLIVVAALFGFLFIAFRQRTLVQPILAQTSASVSSEPSQNQSPLSQIS